MINDLVCINFFINDLVCINFFITQVAESYLLTLYSISSCFFNTISSSIKSQLVLIITNLNCTPPCFPITTDAFSGDTKLVCKEGTAHPSDITYVMTCYIYISYKLSFKSPSLFYIIHFLLILLFFILHSLYVCLLYMK